MGTRVGPRTLFARCWCLSLLARTIGLRVHFVGNSVSRARAFALSASRSGQDAPELQHQKRVCGSGGTSPEGAHCELPGNVSFTWVWAVHNPVVIEALRAQADVVALNSGSHYVFENRSDYYERVQSELGGLVSAINESPARQVWFFTSTRTCDDYYGLSSAEMNHRIERVNAILVQTVRSKTRARVFDAYDDDDASCDAFEDHVHSERLAESHVREWMRRVDALESLSVVASQCREDVDWIFEPFPDAAVCAKRSCVSDVSRRDDTCSIDANVGLETVPYMRYIHVNRDRLPDSVAFLHGHRVAWHHAQKRLVPLDRMIRAARVDLTGYVSLNARFLGPLPPAHLSEISAVWDSVVAPYKGPFPCAAGLFPPCCAQFIVSRQRVLDAAPAEAWSAWADYASESPVHAKHFEFIWHVLFGQPCVMPITDEGTYMETMFDFSRPV